MYIIYIPTIYDMYVNFLCMVNYGAYLIFGYPERFPYRRSDWSDHLWECHRSAKNRLGWVQNWKPFLYNVFFLPQISQYLFLLSLFNSTKSSRSLSIFVPKMTCQVAGVCNVAKGHFAGVVKKDVSSEALLGGRGLFCDSGGFWVVSSGKLWRFCNQLWEIATDYAESKQSK